MAKANYKGSARSKGFSPINMSNNAPQRILNEANRIANGMRTQRDAILDDRRTQSSAMSENFQIEQDQRDLNFKISQENISQSGQGAVDTAQRRGAEQQALYQNLASLSTSAANAVTEFIKAKDEQQYKTDVNEFMVNPEYRKSLLQAHDAMMLENSAALTEANASAVATEMNGARPVDTSRVINTFSGFSAGQKASIFGYKADQFGSYLQAELSGDRQFTDPVTGENFTGAQAQINGVLFGYAKDEILDSFMTENGFYGLSPEFTSKGLESIRKTLATQQAKVEKIETENQKSGTILETRETLGKTTDPVTASSYILSQKPALVWAYDGDQVKATQTILEMVYATDSKGEYVMNAAARQAALATPWGPNGEPLGSFKTLNTEYQNKARKARITAAREDNKIEELEVDALWEEQAEELTSILDKGDVINDVQTFNTWEEQYKDLFPNAYNRGYLPAGYKRLKEEVLNDNKEAEADLVEQASTGMIELTMDQARSIVDPTLREEAIELVQGQMNEEYGGNYENLQKSLKGFAKQLTGSDLSSEGMSPMGQLLVPELNADFKQYYNQELGKLNPSGNVELTAADYALAQQKALERLQQDVIDGKVNGKGKYARKGDTKNNLYEFPNLNLRQRAADLRKRDTNTIKSYGRLGDKAFDAPSLILETADLARITETFDKTGMLDVPPVVMKLSEISGELPVDIINRQIRARGDDKFEEIKPPEAYYELKGQNPEVISLFHNARTPMERARAVAQLPSQLQHRGDVSDFEYFSNAVAGVESTSYGGYNAYNTGGSNNGFTAHGSGNSSDGKRFGKPIVDMTIGEVRRLQNSGQLFATGRYQFIPATFSEVASRLNLPDDTKFSPDVQDRFFVERLVQRAGFGMPLDEALWLEWRGLKYIKDDNPAEYRRIVDTARRLIYQQTGKTYN